MALPVALIPLEKGLPSGQLEEELDCALAWGGIRRRRGSMERVLRSMVIGLEDGGGRDGVERLMLASRE